jgi:hypothetical protein
MPRFIPGHFHFLSMGLAQITLRLLQAVKKLGQEDGCVYVSHSPHGYFMVSPIYIGARSAMVNRMLWISLAGKFPKVWAVDKFLVAIKFFAGDNEM